MSDHAERLSSPVARERISPLQVEPLEIGRGDDREARRGFCGRRVLIVTTVRPARRGKVTSGRRRPRVVHPLEQREADNEKDSNEQEARSLIATEHQRSAPEKQRAYDRR